jgi:ketol-acid reductoisomerase
MEDGFRPLPVGDAVEGAEVVLFAVPEPEQPALFSGHVAPHLAADALVVFLHGSPVFAGALVPGEAVDVVLVRPSGAAGSCLVAVHQDATGTACERALAFARAAHGDGARTLVTTTFSEVALEEIEAEAVRCGGTVELLASWEEQLARAGHEPDEAEVTYYERLRDAVLTRAPGARSVPAPPSSALVVDGRSSGAWTAASRRRGVA